VLEALRLRARRRVRVGDDVSVARGARISVAPGARVVLGRGVVLESGTRISAVGGTVKVGAGARLQERAVVVSHAGVEIGEGAVVGAWACVSGSAPSFEDAERPVRLQPLVSGVVSIGAGALIGPHAVVGPGAVIAAGAVVAPYAVVESPVRPSTERATGERARTSSA